MDWRIELINGKELIEGASIWDISKPIKRIYFTDNINEYGFLNSGKFFINNKILDFKIDIDDFKMEPFQFKTGVMRFSPSILKNNEIVAWNVGYKLINKNELQEYKMTIMNNNQIFFEATRKNGADFKKIRLQ